MAVANASLTYIPLEYVFTGWSIKSPISANSSMASNFCSVSSLVKPMIEVFKYTFSLPVNSGLKPAPSSRSAETLPFT